MAAARRRRVRPAHPLRRRPAAAAAAAAPPPRVMVLGRGLVGHRSLAALGAVCARRGLGRWAGAGRGAEGRA